MPPDHNRHPDYVPAPPANPALPRQEKGVRPARALPYAPVVDGRASSGRFNQISVAAKADNATGAGRGRIGLRLVRHRCHSRIRVKLACDQIKTAVSKEENTRFYKE